MASAEAYRSGALVRVEEKSEGQYEITQIETENELPKPVAGIGDDRVEINWSFGPVKVVGYVVKSTLEIGVELHVLGISLAHLYGNLKDGVVANVNLLLAKGSIKFYLKNGHEVWIHVDVSVKFDGSFNKDVKLLSL
ncbi:hypothetical protein K461DRAFT_315629 [Myriangium duriaei CBS 260.36]|uniref:Uncharacterized protein n=1 Tax=Myriangium duriaei CBS 260.36 TaxID=1168546 RepID=A0A9P4IW78_9PEZI|nr:hypothetical protein K461DRAFT_315629 [Myriangium duriaei CBS 260.36]